MLCIAPAANVLELSECVGSGKHAPVTPSGTLSRKRPPCLADAFVDAGAAVACFLACRACLDERERDAQVFFFPSQNAERRVRINRAHQRD